MTFIGIDGAILITFINTILEHYGDEFRLTNIPGLKKMTGYSDFTNCVSNYVACSDCYTLYNYSNNTYTSWNSKKVSSKTFCGNDLYNSGIRNAVIQKRTFRLFSFDRFNGVLKGFQTNQKSGFEKTYMKKFIEVSSKGDFYHTHLNTITSPSYIPLFSKLTDSITRTIPSGNHQNSPPFFHLPSFLESATNPEQQTFGNEPLPPSALPLVLKEATTMRKSEYGCLLKFYKIEYDDESLCSAKTMIRHRIFVNDRVQKISFINLLGQVYKGDEGLVMRKSYIQARNLTTKIRSSLYNPLLNCYAN
ncbi:hypothetical protein PHYBLDRAFT_165334 [Phycomyces blakesleeanus NRRL 1555(-)]|uniref:Uncharacterized protein n=1 Tax=Phycomyces blakesleeanus (strain ATCC 8743b / DSM 1359 / FGSC 10004 / NBRC 33097 / NRRL 1555) TaxID=763407 RepID=A0A162UKS3_PHYB8|nr:hypothetical protein PHYBLDRAFT_165334 [Phycomyces blakesleeanus NRRL 1555(-)]OAD76832.1 hypothetical protein PHYBLDRAFT_165334 [Phycomyces blakesleeanus NRRL 1555(-)]|eukprot:XP_018294872.1 hypothetical protein PHYBLDRAFT_165334 [Phycomyces blakesleeanus NRRL 1555(-)]